MGLLVDGKWQDRWYDTDSTGGEFKRESARLRDWVVAPDAPLEGPQGQAAVPASADRFHLYVSLACPWAHRALIMAGAISRKKAPAVTRSMACAITTSSTP